MLEGQFHCYTEADEEGEGEKKIAEKNADVRIVL